MELKSVSVLVLMILNTTFSQNCSTAGMTDYATKIMEQHNGKPFPTDPVERLYDFCNASTAYLHAVEKMMRVCFASFNDIVDEDQIQSSLKIPKNVVENNCNNDTPKHAIFGALAGLNQTNLKKLKAFSSYFLFAYAILRSIPEALVYSECVKNQKFSVCREMENEISMNKSEMNADEYCCYMINMISCFRNTIGQACGDEAALFYMKEKSFENGGSFQDVYCGNFNANSTNCTIYQ